MVDKILKFISKSLYKQRLLKLLYDLGKNNLGEYDIKTIIGYQNHFRVRIGNVRIIFEKQWKNNIVKKIDNRWDVY